VQKDQKLSRSIDMKKNEQERENFEILGLDQRNEGDDDVKRARSSWSEKVKLTSLKIDHFFI
jgi:hypothetical protein